jgi:hypothetical protein
MWIMYKLSMQGVFLFLSPAKVIVVSAYLPHVYYIIPKYCVFLKIIVYHFSCVALQIHATFACCLEWYVALVVAC